MFLHLLHIVKNLVSLVFNVTRLVTGLAIKVAQMQRIAHEFSSVSLSIGNGTLFFDLLVVVGELRWLVKSLLCRVPDHFSPLAIRISCLLRFCGFWSDGLCHRGQLGGRLVDLAFFFWLFFDVFKGLGLDSAQTSWYIVHR